MSDQLSNQEINEASDTEIILPLLVKKYETMLNKDSVYGKRLMEIIHRMEDEMESSGEPNERAMKVENKQYMLLTDTEKETRVKISDDITDPGKIFFLFYTLFRKHPEIDRNEFWEKIREETESMLE